MLPPPAARSPLSHTPFAIPLGLGVANDNTPDFGRFLAHNGTVHCVLSGLLLLCAYHRARPTGWDIGHAFPHTFVVLHDIAWTVDGYCMLAVPTLLDMLFWIPLARTGVVSGVLRAAAASFSRLGNVSTYVLRRFEFCF